LIPDQEYINLITDKFIIPTRFHNREMFPGDWNRYKQAIEMLDKVDLGLDEDSKVLDLGSPLPFTTYSLNLKYNSKIWCKDISINQSTTIGDVRLEYFNLCMENLGVQEWDFINFAEVLEHLPCNMFLVREKVISALKDNKYMLISYPLGGRNASMSNYGKDLLNENWFTTHSHLREFTEELAKLFISNLEIVDVQKVIPPTNPDGSLQILYRKEFI